MVVFGLVLDETGSGLGVVEAQDEEELDLRQ